MSVEPPDPTALAAVAQHYGLGLDAADLDQLSPMVAGLLASWDAVEELYNASAPDVPDRTWHRPEDADNPFNAWYVTCEVTGSGNGPLAGKTVAVKDNTAVAGVPLMNGSKTMEGYVPRRDAYAKCNPRKAPFVEHEKGTQLVIEHVEKYWCATTTSEQIIDAKKN